MDVEMRIFRRNFARIFGFLEDDMKIQPVMSFFIEKSMFGVSHPPHNDKKRFNFLRKINLAISTVAAVFQCFLMVFIFFDKKSVDDI